MSKPFHMAELIARIRRHLVEAPAARNDHRYLEAGGVRSTWTGDVPRRVARS